MNELDKSIHDVQEEILYALEKIHKYCIHNRINYSLHGGTLIGAIREHGFIDWDDDADISMTRENYNRFLQAYAKQPIGEGIVFDQIRRKIYVTRQNKPHVWIDLFIYDYITDNRLLQKVKIAGIGIGMALIRSPEMLKSTKIRGKYTGWKYNLICVISKIGQLIPEKSKFKILSRQRMSFPGKKALIHRSNDQFHGIKEILPRKVMEHYNIVPFEGQELMISSEYDTILRRSFGDYMTPIKAVDDINAHNAARSRI